MENTQGRSDDFDIAADIATLESSNGCAPDHWDDSRLALVFTEWQRQREEATPAPVDFIPNDVLVLPSQAELDAMNLQEIDPEEYQRIMVLKKLRNQAESRRVQKLRAEQDAAMLESSLADSQSVVTKITENMENENPEAAVVVAVAVAEEERPLTREELRAQRMKWWASRPTA